MATDRFEVMEYLKPLPDGLAHRHEEASLPLPPSRLHWLGQGLLSSSPTAKRAKYPSPRFRSPIGPDFDWNSRHPNNLSLINLRPASALISVPIVHAQLAMQTLQDFDIAVLPGGLYIYKSRYSLPRANNASEQKVN